HRHTHCRTDRVSPLVTTPQSEQVFDDGYHRSADHSFDPYQPVLYSSWRMNSPNPASEIARASLRLRSIPATLSDSTAMARLLLGSRVVSLLRKSPRRWATFRWILATATRALARLRESRCLRCSALFARHSRRCAAFNAFGAWTSSTVPSSS